MISVYLFTNGANEALTIQENGSNLPQPTSQWTMTKQLDVNETQLPIHFMGGQITQENLEQLKTQGYCILPNKVKTSGKFTS